MARLRSSIPYEILHGISPSLNRSGMLAYLSYFPPPPPVIPAPPPRRSWTCFANPHSSCFISDDLNPSSIRQYIPGNKFNQSIIFNNTSHLLTSTHVNTKSFSLMNFFQNQLTLILLLIIFLSIFVFFLLLLLAFLYFQRLRRRTLLSSSSSSTEAHGHTQTNNNNNFELNEKKNSVFYSRLMPYHRKRSTMSRNPSDGNNLLRLSNHDSPVLPVKRLSALHTNEQEAVL